MRQLRFFLAMLTLLLALGGCGRRLDALVQADAQVSPVPAGLSWAAIPGPGLAVSVADANLPASDPVRNELSGLHSVAAPLAGTLSLYDWKWITSPADADVLVRIWWATSGPEYVEDRSRGYYDPLYRGRYTRFGFGADWGRRGFRGRRGGMFAGSRFGYAEPSIRTVYGHTLTLEALRASSLPEAVRAALLGASPSPSSAEDLSRGPYAPALRLTASSDATDTAEIPADAVLWRVVVSSTGSRDDTRSLLPQLVAAALSLVGKNGEVNVVVDSELQVTFR